MKPLIWKELRENVRWLPVGLLVVGAVCWLVRPGNFNRGLIATDLVTQLAIVTPLLAFALGVAQAFRDLQPAPGAYLNHRSVTPGSIFFAKTISGFALYATAIATPIFIFAGWIAYHGMQWHPMRPAQVIPGLVFCLASFVMHPAAMLMMSRGASWWGTRLFPLVPAAVALIPYFAVLHSGGLWGAGVCTVITIPMLTWMIAIARQGWRDLASDPPASRTNQSLRGRWLLPTYLIVGLALCFVTVLVFGIMIFESDKPYTPYVPVPTTSLAIDTVTGKPWLLTHVHKYNEKTSTYDDTVLGGDSIENGKMVSAMRPIRNTDRFNRASSLIGLRGNRQSDGFFTAPTQMVATPFWYSFDSRGYIICYNNDPAFRWTQTIAADGIRPAGPFVGKPFTADPLGNGSSIFYSFREREVSTPLIDSQGVYAISTQPLSIRKLIDHPIETAVLLDVEKDHAPRLIVRSNDKLFEYQFVDGTGTDTWYKTLITDHRYYRREMQSDSDLTLSAKLLHTYSIPPALSAGILQQIAWTPNGLTILNYRQPMEAYQLSHDDGFDTIAFQVVPSSKPEWEIDRLRPMFVILGLSPGFVGMVVAVVEIRDFLTGQIGLPIWEEIAQHPIQTTTVVMSFLLVSVLAVWLTALVARRCGLSRGQTLAWCWSVLLLGLVAPLSMIAIYRQVHRQSCPKCERQRRVDMFTCEHCGAEWELPANEGIEITDRDEKSTVLSHS